VTTPLLFPFGQTVQRDRRVPVLDTYSQQMVPGDWSSVTTITIPSAFVASSSSSAVQSATRTQALTAKSLYCAPTADVLVGDRIRFGTSTMYVHAKPEADINPFTNWQPVMEIPLEEASG
jgi:hypothetical protein